MSSTPSSLRLWVAFGVVVATTVTAGAAWSRPGGIVGFSGKSGGICTQCHEGGPKPTVTLDGPLSLDAGMLATYTFKIETTNKATGMNAAVSDGTMGVIDGGVPLLQLDEGEVTHTEPNKVDGGQQTYTFTMTAPAYGGDITLYAAGNAVDLSGDELGDNASNTSLTIKVIGPPKPPPDPTPTATATSTAPPPTSTATTKPPTSYPDAGSSGSSAAAPSDDSGCSIGWADRSSMPTSVMFGSIVGLAALARARRRRRA
jgi:hypothetical protein